MNRAIKIKLSVKSRKRNISITISNNLYELLNDEANELGISKSKILEELLKEYIISMGGEFKSDFN